MLPRSLKQSLETDLQPVNEVEVNKHVLAASSTQKMYNLTVGKKEERV